MRLLFAEFCLGSDHPLLAGSGEAESPANTLAYQYLSGWRNHDELDELAKRASSVMSPPNRSYKASISYKDSADRRLERKWMCNSLPTPCTEATPGMD